MPIYKVTLTKNPYDMAAPIPPFYARGGVSAPVLDDVLAQREQINATMQIKLDEVTDRWGVKVMAVEIKEITPPRDIQDAMSR